MISSCQLLSVVRSFIDDRAHPEKGKSFPAAYCAAVLLGMGQFYALQATEAGNGKINFCETAAAGQSFNHCAMAAASRTPCLQSAESQRYVFSSCTLPRTAGLNIFMLCRELDAYRVAAF